MRKIHELPTRLTVAQLQEWNACRSGFNWFKKTFPRGMQYNLKNLKLISARVPSYMPWLTAHLTPYIDDKSAAVLLEQASGWGREDLSLKAFVSYLHRALFRNQESYARTHRRMYGNLYGRTRGSVPIQQWDPTPVHDIRRCRGRKCPGLILIPISGARNLCTCRTCGRWHRVFNGKVISSKGSW